MMNCILLIVGLCIACGGAWLTAHDRHQLGVQQRRRRSDPAP